MGHRNPTRGLGEHRELTRPPAIFSYIRIKYELIFGHRWVSRDGQIGTNPRNQAKKGTNGRPGRTVDFCFRDMMLKIGTVSKNPRRIVTLVQLTLKSGRLKFGVSWTALCSLEPLCRCVYCKLSIALLKLLERITLTHDLHHHYIADQGPDLQNIL